MQILIGLFIFIEVVCCLLLIVLILLQRSKNEGLGLAFGASAGEALFGARAGNVLTKATVLFGITFLVSTLILGHLFSAGNSKSKIDRASTSSLPILPSTASGDAAADNN
jgi:preprotein translocase subunit SecG